MYSITKWSDTFENADSRKRQRLGWVLFPTGCDSIGYIELMAHGADGVAAFGTFASLCQWSATSCRSLRGLLCRSNGSEMTVEQLSAVIRQPVKVVKRSLQLLVEVGWLKYENTGLVDENGDDLPMSAGDLPVSAGSIPQNPRLLKEKEKEKLFVRFWKSFDLKIAKPNAEKAFRKAVEAGGDAELIIRQAGRYHSACEQSETSQAHPATWLNAKRWEDEDMPPPRQSNGNGKPQSKGVMDHLDDMIEEEQRNEQF